MLLLLLLWLPPGGATAPISCYNDKGEAVDWFYIYKLPKHHNGMSGSGLSYLLLERGSDHWTEGKANMNDSFGAAGRTLGQLYSLGQSPDVSYILYNDQPPENFAHVRNGYGHTKGVVLLDRLQGFWLIHSTPHFPAGPAAGHYRYPPSGQNYGQNFLCVTFPIERFQTIGEQLQINQPQVYNCSIAESLASVAPALAAVCRKEAVAAQIRPHIRPVSNRSVTLTSRDGTNFTSFAKGASFHNDLYLWWVAPTLQSDLLVQFWVRSSGVLPSNCSRSWKVLDIKTIQPGQTSSFNSSQDHSKWAVSTHPPPSGGWVCVGDINRNKAEEQRGGGTVCLQDPQVWKAYRRAALQCENCGHEITACPMSILPPGGRLSVGFQ
ncbi:unnamed protein product [Ophioblennius macclurei]